MGSLVACSQAEIDGSLPAPSLERSLEERFAAGREDAFEQALRRYQQDVARLAARLLGFRRGHEVDDIVQEVFIRAYLKRRTFRGDSALATWLSRITVNCVRSFQRRRILRLEMLWRSKPQEERAVDHGIQLSEEARCARLAVSQLHGRDREVVVLHYLEEMPVALVAQVTGMSEGAVTVRLHRARKKLSQLLGGTAHE